MKNSYIVNSFLDSPTHTNAIYTEYWDTLEQFFKYAFFKNTHNGHKNYYLALYFSLVHTIFRIAF